MSDIRALVREAKSIRNALDIHRVACRVRTIDGKTRVDVYWIPPTDYDPTLKPFMRALPLAFVQELTLNRFKAISDPARVAALFDQGVFTGVFESGEPGALEIARGLAIDHFIKRDNEIIEWADAARSDR